MAGRGAESQRGEGGGSARDPEVDTYLVSLAKHPRHKQRKDKEVRSRN